MADEKLDPVSGRHTTGHEWNGIEELDTPIPRVVTFFLVVSTLFSIGYWILMPAWPLGWTYTKGLLGIDQRDVVTQQVEKAAAERATWTSQIANMSYPEIEADKGLMRNVMETGRTLFVDNCAACHGVRGDGGPGFPNLAAGAWLWGGAPEKIAETITVGINSTDKDTRVSQMLAFGRDGMLDATQIAEAAAYVRSLSGQKLGEKDTARVAAGKMVFAANCASCHGENGKGMVDLGAPDLTDSHWIYGGDADAVVKSIYGGRQGHMPHWNDRLSPVDIKILALYVGALSGEKP